MHPFLVAILQGVSLALISFGFWMQWPWVGVVVGGVGLLAWVVLDDYLAALTKSPEVE